MSIHTVVLAAGASTRMGSPKALLDLGGATFVSRITTTARAAGTDGVCVVLGPPHGAAIKAKLPPGAGSAWNPDPARGMLSSIQTAVASVPSRTTAILVWPVDLPEVKLETVRQLLDAAPGKLVVPRHGGKGGHPVRIPRALFGALAALDPALGLRALIDAHAATVAYVEVDDQAVLTDIDTPEEHAAARREKPARRAK